MSYGSPTSFRRQIPSAHAPTFGLRAAAVLAIVSPWLVPAQSRSAPAPVARAASATMALGTPIHPVGTLVGPLAPTRPLGLALTLQRRDPAGETAFARAVSTPGSPLYRRFLTPRQFSDRFGPSPSERNAVAGYLTAHGFTVTNADPLGSTMDVTAPVRAIEETFGLRVNDYSAANGIAPSATVGVRRHKRRHPVVGGSRCASGCPCRRSRPVAPWLLEPVAVQPL